MQMDMGCRGSGRAPVAATGATRNRLLSGLRRDELAVLRPHLTAMDLMPGQVLCTSGDVIRQVFFIERGLASLLANTGPDDVGIEVGMIGREGVVGLAATLGASAVALHDAVVQQPGAALRMPFAQFRRHLEGVPSLRHACMRHLDALSIQISQRGACNGRHGILQRYACWLLAACDRCESLDLPFSHEVMSLALGVRRAGITVALRKLQASGLIKTGRSHVMVLDRAGLEHAACDCYQAVCDLSGRLPG